LYDNIDRDKIYKILDNFTENNKEFELLESEEKLKELRNAIILDLAKRENLIINLAEFITKEKEIFFNYENSL
jgi:hypothetical protein